MFSHFVIVVLSVKRGFSKSYCQSKGLNVQNMLENQIICRTWRIFGHIGKFNCLGQGTPEQPLGKKKKKQPWIIQVTVKLFCLYVHYLI